MKTRNGWVFVAAIGTLTTGCARNSDVAIDDPEAVIATGVGGDSDIVRSIEEAADATGVPASVLAAIAYAETRFQHADVGASEAARDGHHGAARVGLFALTPAEVSLAGAQGSARSHAFAAATLLASRAGDPATLELSDWHGVIASWRGAPFADTVMGHLVRGLRGVDALGNRITVTARPGLEAFATDVAVTSYAERQGYADAIWNPAHSSNFSAASRGAGNINYIVIHTIQGSYGSAINWFKDPVANVSAHYVVKSSNGEVTQMVDDSDRAWHDACFNAETIGIEHEGYVSDPDLWYTESMYMASARLAADLAQSYNIPIDRQHFFGHGDAPDCSTHTDPGPGWDWDHFMALVRDNGMPQLDAALADFEWPSQMTSGEEAVVWFEFDNLSNMTWGLDDTRLGTTDPQDRDSAFFVDGNWLSANRATGADHSNYTPGTTGRFTFLIRAPEVDEPTTFNESFQLVQEGVAWFGPTATATVRVVPRGWSGGDGEDGEGPELGEDTELSGAGCAVTQSGGPTGCGYAILFACALLGFYRRSRRR